MKRHNLMDGQNYLDQQLMHRWFWQTVFLMALLCVGVVLVSAQQYFAYAELCKECMKLKFRTTDLHSCLEQKRALKEQAAGLQTRLAKIHCIKDRPKNPVTILEMLAALSADVTLHEIILKKKKLDLVLFAHDAKVLFVYAAQLRAHALNAHVEIGSFEQAGDRIKAAVHIVLR